jgi:hypothetical protein
MWAQLLSALVGVWLMAAPAVLGYGAPVATSDRIVGPLVAAFAITAAWEVTRALRWPNAMLASWLILSPFVLGEGELDVAISHIVAGALIGALSLVRGRMKHSFAGGWAG